MESITQTTMSYELKSLRDMTQEEFDNWLNKPVIVCEVIKEWEPQIITESDMHTYCNNNRESDGFCRCSSACSGPCYSNLQRDHDDLKRLKKSNPKKYENVHVYSGGNYGSCTFYVREE